MIRTLLFDAYGTLLDTGTGSVDATRAILRNAGSALDPVAFYAEWKQLHHQHFAAQTAFVTERETYVLDLAELYRRHGIGRDARADMGPMWSVLGARTAYPEARPILAALRRDYAVAVASISDTAPLKQDLQRAGLGDVPFFTSECLRSYKPQPAFYEAVLDALHCPPEQAVYIGDSPVEDIQGPQRAGMRAVWVNRKGRALPLDIHPDVEMPSLTPLPHWLARQKAATV